VLYVRSYAWREKWLLGKHGSSVRHVTPITCVFTYKKKRLSSDKTKTYGPCEIRSVDFLENCKIRFFASFSRRATPENVHGDRRARASFWNANRAPYSNYTRPDDGAVPVAPPDDHAVTWWSIFVFSQSVSRFVGQPTRTNESRGSAGATRVYWHVSDGLVTGVKIRNGTMFFLVRAPRTRRTGTYA